MNQTISHAVQRAWITPEGITHWIDIDQGLKLEHAEKLLSELRKTVLGVEYRMVKRITEDIPIQ